MLKGCRVVRGPDWAGRNTDGGEGSLGVAVSVNEAEGKVKVIWDTGHEGQYRAGHDGRFELSIYDNAQAGISHKSVTCDVCKVEPVLGIRWKCATCTNFDLCNLCYMGGKHSPAHPFLRHDSQMSTLVPVPARKQTPPVALHGILQGASVMRGLHWEWGNDDGGKGNVGEVTVLAKWGSGSYRGGARVTWPNGFSNEYRVGGDGCSDLVYIAESQIFNYYPQHLPVFDARHSESVQLKTGDKVRVDVDRNTVEKVHAELEFWNPKMKDYMDDLGTVMGIKEERIVMVQYQDSKTWAIFRSMLTKIHSFKHGDLVRILDNFNAVQELQHGHGGWNDDMECTLGGLGVIENVDDDGDLKVKVRTASWLFSPAVCVPVDLASLTDAEMHVYEELVPQVTPVATKKAEVKKQDSIKSLGDSDEMNHGIMKLLLQMIQEHPSGQGSRPSDLIEAAAHCDLDTVQKIVQTSRQIVNETVDGKSALQIACYKGHKDIVVALVTAGANLDLADNDGDTPLHHAIQQSKTEIVEFLLEKGVKKNLKNNKGLTGIHMAVNLKSESVILALLKRSCELNTQDNDGDTPFHDVLTNCSETVAKWFLQFKTLKLDLQNEQGLNALHNAVMLNKERLIEGILERGPITVNSRTGIGNFTALHIAAVNGFTFIANILLKKGANVNSADETGKTALHLAVSSRSMPMIDILLCEDADINAQDNEGNTPSHLAHLKVPLGRTTTMSSRMAAQPDPDMSVDIPYLLAQQGADLTIRNNNNQTPLDLFENQQTASLFRRMAQKSVKLTSNDLAPPMYWGSMRGQHVLEVTLTQDSPGTQDEYAKVCKSFTRTLVNKTVVKIQRIQNTDRWEPFAVLKRKMERAYGRGCANEKYLFHGTRPDIVARIVRQGVDFRVVERALYGNGAYFAEEAKLSDGYTAPDDNGHRFMFMTKVLVGKYTQGQKGMKKPPPVDARDPDKFYDTVVDREDSPRIYVVFDNSQCYPEYLIEYK